MFMYFNYYYNYPQFVTYNQNVQYRPQRYMVNPNSYPPAMYQPNQNYQNYESSMYQPNQNYQNYQNNQFYH